MGIKIGADPEFCFKKSGRLVDASRVIGYDDRGELGTDMSADTAEIRPKAGTYWEVARSISKILTQAARFGYDGYAGSGDSIPLGGHIHFSGIEPSKKLLMKLNRFIAIPLNTVSLTKLRRFEGYGRLNDEDTIRYNHHGWEYRAPASWLSTPILTKGVLTISWVLARAEKHDELNKISNVEKLIAYANKTEAVHIRLFFDAIKSYKDSNTKLEQIEMFAAWKKSSTGKRPEVNIKFDTYGEFMNTLRQGAGHLKCQYPLFFFAEGFRSNTTFYGVSLNEEIQGIDTLKEKLKDLKVSVSRIKYEEDVWQIGLNYHLRKDTFLCVEVIKRIVECFNTGVLKCVE